MYQMKVIVISNPEQLPGEEKAVNELFKAGLSHFHIRKPKTSTNGLRRYIESIDQKFHQRVIIHSHHELSIAYSLRGIHLTEHHRQRHRWRNWMKNKYIKLRRPGIEMTAGYHTIGALKGENPGYAYVFLSPVFASISKIGYKSSFNEVSLKEATATTSFRVVALGGVDEENIHKAREMGFYGVALLGCVWKSPDPVQKFIRILELCKEKEIT